MRGGKRPIDDEDARRLSELTRVERGRLQLASVLSAAASALWIAQALVLAQAVGALLGTDARIDNLAPAAAAFALLAIARTALDTLSALMAARAAEQVQLRLRGRLLDAVARSSPLDARRAHSGEVAAILTHHVEALAPYLRRYGPARVRVALVPAVMLLAMLPVSWAAAAILCLAGPLIPIFMGLIGQHARAASERQLGEIGTMNGFLLDRLQGLVTLRLLDGIERAADGLMGVTAHIHRSTMAMLRLAFLSSAVLELFSALGVAMVAAYVGFDLLGYIDFGTYGTPLTLAGGLNVLLLAPEFFQPLRDFAAAYHDRAAALAASREIGRILESSAPSLLGARSPSPHAFSAWGEAKLEVRAAASMRLQNISLVFDGMNQPALCDVSLAIRPGEHVALVGPSGCGKSMLLGVIAGLVCPTSGEVLVGGAPLTDANADDWRQLLAWVGQRPPFVRGSVRANLTLGRPTPGAAGIQDLVTRLGAGAVIDRLPHGLATVLGENSEGVSGGEAQRLALVRAALADADVILADEPTEHLDAETAEVVIAGLLQIAEGRTLLVATHDKRLINRMQRVVDVEALQAPTARRSDALEAAE
jgi:ATP-binding cassette, subfamily C, bacterial CydD